MSYKSLLVMIVCLVFTVGCASSNTNNQKEIHKSSVTYGMAKKHILIGETTQSKIIEIFGSPDNMVMKNGEEMWIYDKFKVETNTSSNSGYGTIIFAGQSSKNSHSSTYVKTLTIIIEFNKSSIVKDYSMRVGGY